MIYIYKTRSCLSSSGKTGCKEISPWQTCDRTPLCTKWYLVLSGLFLSNPRSLQQWCGEAMHGACVCWNRDTCWCSQAPHSSWSIATPGCCCLTSRAALLTTATAGSSRCSAVTKHTCVSGVSTNRKSSAWSVGAFCLPEKAASYWVWLPGYFAFTWQCCTWFSDVHTKLRVLEIKTLSCQRRVPRVFVMTILN